MSKKNVEAASPSAEAELDNAAHLQEGGNPPEPVLSGKTVKARVLRDCQFGRADQVVKVPVEHIDVAVASGAVDAHPEAVAYAESL